MGTVRGTPNCPLTYGFDSINQDCLTAQLLQVKQNLFLKFHSSNMAQRRTKKNQFWTLTDLYMRKYELYLLYLIYESSSFRYLSLLSTPLYWGINPTNKLHSSTVLCTPIHPVEISFWKYKYDLLIQTISFCLRIPDSKHLFSEMWPSENKYKYICVLHFDRMPLPNHLFAPIFVRYCYQSTKTTYPKYVLALCWAFWTPLKVYEQQIEPLLTPIKVTNPKPLFQTT